MSQLVSTYRPTRKSNVGLLLPRLRRNLLLWLLTLGLAILPVLMANPMLAAPAAPPAASAPPGEAAKGQPIPFDQLGATGDQQGAGAASRIQATATGALLRSGWQAGR